LYIPEHFRESRPEVLHALMRRHALAALVAVTPSGLTANHIPMQLEIKSRATYLRGHVARGNPLWRELPDGSTVLAIFRGSDHYVTPSAYPSKKETGRAVPTWNYTAVHAHGSIRFIRDPAWLRSFVESLTDEHERTQLDPWHVSDAPSDYIDLMLHSIVGFEIEVARLDGKVKGSQNRAEADRLGVAAALRTAGMSPADVLEIAPPP
jgi:transcriptional regulator